MEKILTVEAFNVIAAALSLTLTVPVVFALKVPAVVETLYVTALPARLSEPVLALLLTQAVPLVLAVIDEVVLPVVILLPVAPISPEPAFNVRVGVVILPVD